MVTIFRTWRRFLACGYVAKGRMEEPLQIVERIKQYFNDIKQKAVPASSSFIGKHVLITAGPTVEELDPVRFYQIDLQVRLDTCLLNL